MTLGSSKQSGILSPDVWKSSLAPCELISGVRKRREVKGRDQPHTMNVRYFIKYHLQSSTKGGILLYNGRKLILNVTFYHRIKQYIYEV